MKVLEGITVLDLSRVLAGPFCTMILADHGAEVIKIEIPGKGDDSRSFGPYIKDNSAYFMSLNRNKKSITLNLKKEEARDILKEMVRDADVIVENFRPGTMEKLGLGYHTLKEINPAIIYAAISGFGHTGPYMDKPAYDIIAQGMGGLMSITGPDEDTPTRVGASIGDMIAALNAAVGILFSLFRRQSTGKGQKVDIAMLDCQVSILENALARYYVTGESPKPLGNRHPSISPFTSFKTKDSYIIIAVGNDSLWEKFCHVTKQEDLLEDERFKTNSSRTDHWGELEPILAKIMIQDSTGNWVEKFENRGIPCGPINNIEMVVNDPQVLAREMIEEVEHKEAGKMKMAGVPIKLSDTPGGIDTPAPLLGEHTDMILRERLNHSLDQIEELRRIGAI